MRGSITRTLRRVETGTISWGRRAPLFSLESVLIWEDRREDGLRGVPAEVERDVVVVG